MSRLHADRFRVTPIGGVGAPLTYTPAITWPGNTISGATGQYIKEAGKLTLWVSFQETAGIASAILTIPLPAGYVAVTLAGSLTVAVGPVIAPTAGSTGNMSATAGATSLTSGFAIGGSVNSFAGFFVVPTTT